MRRVGLLFACAVLACAFQMAVLRMHWYVSRRTPARRLEPAVPRAYPQRFKLEIHFYNIDVTLISVGSRSAPGGKITTEQAKEFI